MKHNQFYDELLDLMSAERRAIAYGRLHYEPTEYYRNLAALFKFSTVYKQSIAEDVQYDSVDEGLHTSVFIDSWMCTHSISDYEC